MTIEIRDPSLEARIQKQLQASVEEVLLRLLDTLEEQDRWLTKVPLARDGKPR